MKGEKEGFFGKIFGTNESSNEMKAVELTSKAFYLLSKESMIHLFANQAIKINPLCGDAKQRYLWESKRGFRSCRRICSACCGM
jgi:hypothetical protein